jgi:methionine biosynthesis protein MetW
MSEHALRPDLALIASLIPDNTKVLDAGCGDGSLLAALKQRGIEGRGIELDPALVQEAVARGVSVIQGDMGDDLRDFPTGSADYVVLSHSLQMLRDPSETLRQILRIGNHAIVSVPNFAHWRNRIALGLHGRVPVTKVLPYQWYDSPNIRFFTLVDFMVLCEELGFTIEKRLMVRYGGAPARFTGHGIFANLLGEQGVFLLSRG